MSPTVFRESGYRFFFFSREEARMYSHVTSPDGEAKFWLEPELELAKNRGLSQRQLRLVELLIQEHRDDIVIAWRTHFSG